ncbi:chemotaxis protein CheA [Yersinia mollaretii]|uniref:chemotaxis protein CheA n=1 Tax=Yersinia mollaretii TaxID=33060 RepID=UPI0005DB5A81|nr:chemotaxis protein CheA [Yersinia mollaretii]MDA5528380.1 chemotaxis protein CheA [Yersinia mollaretii]MDR7874347.1 chemotaxis protein CheA [Yersinia mollaretii]PHZ32474.1 chemotaxis protein CheA [Yersinia mollaretii]WQC74717.1 chemotaxis protein CheA [Yersinia mollaretii]CNF65846.1 chemotaxis protein CheA [Yersinia mollaretii]
MDISDFYQTFFDEADELLADMEMHLLELDYISPDKEMLNAIFRAAHSIKGGAGTFGFTVLQETTHILENLLDDARRGELRLNSDIVNLFLESKDIMQDQLDAYKSSREPDQESFHYICEALRQIALEDKKGIATAASEPKQQIAVPSATVCNPLTVSLTAIPEADKGVLLEELANLGEVLSQQQQADVLQIELQTTASADDILAVLCFILEPEQITITASESAASESALDIAAAGQATQTTSAVQAGEDATVTPNEASSEPSAASPTAKPKATAKAPATESSSLRVAVEKVDQIINQVGELIITQAMLSQLSSSLDPAQHDTLISSIGQMERNARDLQESVMSIRMMPMEYVFSRFPRLVHDLGGKLDKEVELTLIGGSAELDKSLIERIIDPLTHLVRNSLDHGLESAEVRQAKGKTGKGNLTLSAEHHGGSIVIEVIDDGAGLNREKILARAKSQGMAISDSWSDEDIWMLIFAAGFSTAEKVTDVSGRGVGMDVVRRNILAMGGHVEIHSVQDKGTTIRIILPLTLAILDGMSVRVGDEIYVLPLGTVMESLKPSENALYRMAGDELMLQVRGEYLPLIELHRIFDIKSDSALANDGIAVILQSAGCRYALLVDQLIGQHQVVVKNLELNYRKVPGISAATILGDGSVALILDVAALSTLSKK